MDYDYSFIAVVVVAFIVFLWLFFYFIPLGLWYTAIFSKVNVPISSLIGMRIRKVPPAIIINNLIRAKKAEVELKIDELEALFLAGGNVDKVVSAMVLAKSAGYNLDFKTASGADLSGVDVEEKIKEEIAK